MNILNQENDITKYQSRERSTQGVSVQWKHVVTILPSYFTGLFSVPGTSSEHEELSQEYRAWVAVRQKSINAE